MSVEKMSKEEQVKLGNLVFNKYQNNLEIYDTEELSDAYKAGVVDGFKEATANKCIKHGHNMQHVYSLNNFDRGGSSAFGENKCSRCGHKEEWQYDFV
jgi:hypothetical protein